MSNKHETKHYEKKAIPTSLAYKILHTQQKKIYQKFTEEFPPTPNQSILDLGVNGNPKKRIDCYFEHYYPYKEKIVAYGLETPDEFKRIFPEVDYQQGNRSCILPFHDNEFDIVFCSAVIEHVGSRTMQKQFLREILRIGKSAFVTTPNRWYPVEFHTVTPLLHYLPASLYRRIYQKLGFEFFAQEENLNLLDKQQFKKLIPKGKKYKFRYHHFLGLRSNLILITNEPPTL